MASRAQLIRDVIEQIERVWGPEGFDGSTGGYEWLQTHCGITEAEDVRWQIVLAQSVGDDQEELEDNDHVFLADDQAVSQLLEDILQKYKNSPTTYPRHYPAGSLEHARAALNEHCFRNDCALIKANSFPEREPRILLGLDAFLRAIAAESPGAVYWTESVFDVDEFIESELREFGWEPDGAGEDIPLNPDEIRKLLPESVKQVSLHAGKLCKMTALFHGRGGGCWTGTLTPDWLTEFAAQITDLIENYDDDLQASLQASDAKDAVLMEGLVAELAGNEVFRKTRGLNKRLMLAKTLVGDRVPPHRSGRLGCIAQHGLMCDLNLVNVARDADQRVFAESSLTSKQ